MFAALVLWLRYVALPNIDGYRDLVVSSIEKASGMSVSVRAMHGHWGGLRPLLSLEGFTLADRAGKAAFELQRAEVTLAWWSLLSGEVRFHDVDFYRPHLELRRGADGLIYLADKPLNEASPGDDGAFTAWLLAQPRLGIHDATLTWRDDFLGAPPVTLTQVEIHVAKRHGRHAAALTAKPPVQRALPMIASAPPIHGAQSSRRVVSTLAPVTSTATGTSAFGVLFNEADDSTPSTTLLPSTAYLTLAPA